MTDKNVARSAYRNCNQVSLEQIWKESVKRELTSAKRWEKNWGFMTEFDSKGNQIRTKKDVPQRTTFYKDNGLPLTSSQQYGARLSTNSTNSMFKLEKLTSFHKRKTDVTRLHY